MKGVGHLVDGRCLSGYFHSNSQTQPAFQVQIPFYRCCLDPQLSPLDLLGGAPQGGSVAVVVAVAAGPL